MLESLLRLVARRAAVFGLTLIATVIVLFSVEIPPAFAQSLSQAPIIFDMRKSLPLEPDEQAVHDFYINAGNESGFKKGMFVTVVRLVPVHDPVQNKQQGLLSVTVARLKVVQADRSITVARLDEEFSDEDRPTLEFEAVMIGDRVDPNSMTMEAPGTDKKKKKEPRKPAAKTAEALLPKADADSASFVAITPIGLSAAAAASGPGNESKAPLVETKNASAKSGGPDMVRIPVPSAPAGKL